VIERRLMATHPPATAGGTDLFQVRLLTFEAKPPTGLELYAESHSEANV